MALLLVFVGGMGGASLRYLIERAVVRRWRGTALPWGAFAVNIGGCFMLGVLTGGATARDLPVWVTVLLGAAITTFSVFGYETFELLRQGLTGRAGARALGGWLMGTAAAVVGVLVSMG
jgi:CrcB protein